MKDRNQRGQFARSDGRARTEDVSRTTRFAPPTGSDTEARTSMIRERAYQRYLARGGDPGSALDDWLAAEREVDGL